MGNRWLIRKLTCFFKQGLEENNKEKIEELEYGISVAVQNLLKTLLLIVLIVYLKIFWYVAVFMAAYSLLRIFSFGIHVRSSIICTIWGLLNYIGGAFLAMNIRISIFISTIIFVLCFILLWLYAPAGTEARPIGTKQYGRLKLRTLTMLTLLFTVSLILKILGEVIYYNIIVLSMAAQTINVLPITYKIFNEGRC